MIMLAHFKKQRYLWGVITVFLLFTQEISAIGTDLKGKIVISTQHELYIINLEDEHSWKTPMKIPLPHKSDMAHYPAWMPDGENVIFEYSPWSEDINNLKKYFAVINIKNKKVTQFENFSVAKSENLAYPKCSPNGKLLAFLYHKETEFIKDGKGTIIETKYVNRLIVLDKTSLKHKILKQAYATRSPLSWSSDSKKIAYGSSDGRIAVYDLDTNNTLILDKGSYPVFHPITNQIYYISPDTYLYRIGIDGKGCQKVDDSDWSWFQLVDISKDGNALFFIGGGSFLVWEYSTISVFNLISHKQKKISKKYGIIHGASLFEVREPGRGGKPGHP